MGTFQKLSYLSYVGIAYKADCCLVLVLLQAKYVHDIS
jgi:hypothetical protein